MLLDAAQAVTGEPEFQGWQDGVLPELFRCQLVCGYPEIPN